MRGYTPRDMHVSTLLENFIGRRIFVAVIEPSFNDAHVVSESDES